MFERILRKPSSEIVDDSQYRAESYQSVFSQESWEAKSLVDFILYAVIEDVNVRVDAVLTFNYRDFREICAKNDIVCL